MAERVQTKCFERWVGQIVYRSCTPSIGPYAHQTVGIRRGVIKSIFERPKYTFKNGSQLHETHFDVSINWHTLEIGREEIPETFNAKRFDFHPRVSVPFDAGLTTLFEYDILCRGGLLSSLDEDYFKEPQSEHLKALLPLYQKVLDNPDAPYVLNENVTRRN